MSFTKAKFSKKIWRRLCNDSLREMVIDLSVIVFKHEGEWIDHFNPLNRFRCCFRFRFRCAVIFFLDWFNYSRGRHFGSRSFCSSYCRDPKAVRLIIQRLSIWKNVSRHIKNVSRHIFVNFRKFPQWNIRNFMKICEILQNFTKICFDTFLICLDAFFQIYSLWIISLTAFGNTTF